MYSNLRVVGGSNHLLLPTNLLRLTGAVVRVEACSSAAVNALYPGDSFLSALTPPGKRELRARDKTAADRRLLLRLLAARRRPPASLGPLRPPVQLRDGARARRVGEI